MTMLHFSVSNNKKTKQKTNKIETQLVKKMFSLLPPEQTLWRKLPNIQGCAWVHEPMYLWRLFFFFFFFFVVYFVIVCSCVFVWGATACPHQCVGYAALSTTWYKTRYPTYASVADWLYAGIQLLFITPKLGRFIYPDRISLQDLSAPTLLCTRARAAVSLTTLSARQKTGKGRKNKP